MASSRPSPATIRAFRSDDASGVINVWNTALPSSQPWNDPRIALPRKLIERDQMLFVAQADDQIVGTVAAGYDGVRGWIYHLAVLEAFRRRGIGRQLVQQAEAALISRGCPKINLQVRGSGDQTGDSHSTAEFYRRCGYEAEDRLSFGKAVNIPKHRPDGVPELRISDEISLSAFQPNDHAALLTTLNETNRFRENSGVMPFPYTPLDADQWLMMMRRETIDHDHSHNWAIRSHAGELIGGVGFINLIPKQKGEVGYWIRRDQWGQGIATLAVNCVCRHAFETWQLRRIHAQVFTANQASARVLEKCGFELEGLLKNHGFVDGTAVDVKVFGLIPSSGEQQIVSESQLSGVPCDE